MIEYVTFQSFYSEEEANELAKLLEENGIPAQVIKGKVFDKVIAGDGLEKTIYLNIKNSDFKKANELLERIIEENLSKVENDYYLYSFSDKELLEVMNKPDEWSKQDFVIARKILLDRGIDISQKSVDEMKWKRTLDLAKHETVHGSYILLGYIIAILFGVIGLFFGLPYVQAKKILPDGTKTYVYDENTRHHGKVITIISIVVGLIYVMKTANFYFPFFSLD